MFAEPGSTVGCQPMADLRSEALIEVTSCSVHSLGDLQTREHSEIENFKLV